MSAQVHPFAAENTAESGRRNIILTPSNCYTLIFVSNPKQRSSADFRTRRRGRATTPCSACTSHRSPCLAAASRPPARPHHLGASTLRLGSPASAIPLHPTQPRPVLPHPREQGPRLQTSMARIDSTSQHLQQCPDQGFWQAPWTRGVSGKAAAMLGPPCLQCHLGQATSPAQPPPTMGIPWRVPCWRLLSMTPSSSTRKISSSASRCSSR
jgi:hypothetical protein